jgi:hypothetical protein
LCGICQLVIDIIVAGFTYPFDGQNGEGVSTWVRRGEPEPERCHLKAKPQRAPAHLKRTCTTYKKKKAYVVVIVINCYILVDTYAIGVNHIGALLVARKAILNAAAQKNRHRILRTTIIFSVLLDTILHNNCC